jgi:hypothetical protein
MPYARLYLDRVRVGAVVVVALSLAPGVAEAQPDDAHVRADDVTLEARSQALWLRGHVDVEADPFHLTSDELRVTRTPRGLLVEGDGRVAFCPCLGEPVALTFPAAIVAPPGDLFLTRPRLEAFGVPVFWLPYFWLRSPGRVGLLPPEVAYRGSDGVFLGEGVHVPWRVGETDAGLDVRAGAYLEGGLAVDTTLTTPSSVTSVRWDELRSSGFAVDARGSTATPPDSHAATTLSWDADLLRGPRGVVSTTDLDAASRVFDRAAAEGSRRGDGWVIAAGLTAENVRGSGAGEIDAWGPVVRARESGALGGVGAYDATLESGAVSGAGLPATLSFGRADVGSLLATRAGPVSASLSLRGAADLAASGLQSGYDSAAAVRGRLALPLVRAYGSSDGAGGADEPWRHRVEPEIEVAGLVARGDGVLGELPTPGALQGGGAWVAGAGFRTSLGQWGGRRGLELGGDVGGVGGEQQPASLAVRWRAAASAPYVGLGAEGADVAGSPQPGSTSEGWGHAVTARARLGSTRSVSVALLVAGRDGVDPVLARALTDAPLAASYGFLATTGWTSGARVTVPITALVTARGGVDGDLTLDRLVAAHGALEVHDRCRCVVVRLSAAERLGRDGVDVWLSVDLVPAR